MRKRKEIENGRGEEKEEDENNEEEKGKCQETGNEESGRQGRKERVSSVGGQRSLLRLRGAPRGRCLKV